MDSKFKIRFEAGAYFMTNALRQLGYTNYTAIADIVDNSIERNVGASNVRIDLLKKSVKEGKKYIYQVDGILICDDGCGMDSDTLHMCMRLGSRTGKELSYNLGCYGAGLKTAAISIGRCLTVYTKTEDGLLLSAVLDIDTINEEDDTIDIAFDSHDEESDEYKFFVEHVKDTHGTIVKISTLDRIQSNDYRQFEGTLSKHLRILFNKFIQKDACSFILNGNKLSYFDTIGNNIGLGTELLDEGSFTYNGSHIDWKCWNIPKGAKIDVELKDGFSRKNAYQGIYIYRQMRLVGFGLDLGMAQKSGHWTNGLRFELFMDGTADQVFGTTFTKMITEKDKSGIEQGFYDKLKSIVAPFVSQIHNAEERAAKKEDDVSQEYKEELSANVESMNKSVLLRSTMKQKGSNNKGVEPKERNNNPKKQENPNPTKNRTGKWLGGYEFINDGKTGFMYATEKRNGLYWVLINQDHAFFERIFKNLDRVGRESIASFLACECSALERSGYYTNDDAHHFIDQYKQFYADAVMRHYNWYAES